MDEFLILLQAKLDEAKSKENINKTDIPSLQGKLDHLKIQAELDPKTAQKLADDIGKLINQKIVISNIDVNQSNLSKTGQQVGQVISDSAKKAIGDVTSKNIGKYFRVSQSDSRQFQAEMEKLVSGWTNGKGKVTDVNIQTRTSYDEKEQKNIERLHQATVTYKNELDEVIKKTIAWRQIGTTTNAKGEDVALRGFVEVAGQYSKSIDTVSAKTDNFVEKKKKAVTDLTNKLNKYYREGIDQGSSKPIKDQSHLSELKKRYDEIVSAIGKVGTASKTSFGDEQNSVNTLISDLQILIKEYKNAETVATSLRSKDISTVKSEYSSKLDNLVTKMKSSGLYSDGFQKGANNLSNILKNATDASGLTSFLNGLDKLDAGYKRAKVSAEAFNQSQKVGIKVSGLQSKIADLQRISPEIENFKTQVDGAEVSVQSLYNNLSKVSTPSDLSVVTEKWTAFRNAAKAAGIAVTEFSSQSKQADSIQVEQTIVRLNNQLRNNSKYSKNAKDKIRAWISELEKGGVASETLRKINVDAKELHSNMEAIGKSGQGFFSKILSKINSFGAYLSAATVISKSISLIKNGVSTVRELDTTLVDLEKTTSMTSGQLEDFYYNSNDVAKQMGITTAEIINQASAWSRLGFSSEEAVTKMAKYSSMFASISPGMSTDEAQEGLVSIIKAWNLDVDDVEREVLDNINTLGNRFAESNYDLVQGMKRSAAALAATGTTYQDAFALFTGAQEVVQNAEVTGRALRSISMRIHGYSENSEDGLAEVDEELNTITGDLIDLTKTAEHSQGVSIFKDGSNTEFKSLVDYFGEINKIWDEMSQKQQNDFLDKAFGKNQAQAGAAIIQNYEAISDAIKAMENAGGSADREMSIIIDSIDYKLNHLKETGTGIAQNLFNKDDIKSVLDLINSIGDGLDWLTDKIGLFGSAGALSGLIMSIKGIGEYTIF